MTEEKQQRRTRMLFGLPTATFFILGNELCERFTFYGMKAILQTFLISYLKMSEMQAKGAVHLFNSAAYFCPLFGALLSDSYLGKFKTILYLSTVYCAGNFVLALTAIPGVTGVPPSYWGMMLGLILIAIGTGGIKPCVASFGADQIDPEDSRAMARYFSIFYMAINAGSLVSTYMTPILGRKVSCFGSDSCYPLGFGVPAVLMLVAVLIFLCGSGKYTRIAPTGNLLSKVVGTYVLAVKNRLKFGKMEGSPPIITYALIKPEKTAVVTDEERSFVSQIRQLGKVLVVFIPVIFFWTLYDQQNTAWMTQGYKMSGKFSLPFIGSQFEILAEQIIIANPLMILALVPILDRLVYPVLERYRMMPKPLTRMLFGMLLCSLSFVMTALLEMVIEANGTFAIVQSRKVCTDGCVTIFAQLPQYFILTLAEVLLNVTCMDFAYSQAPASMKSICQAVALLAVSLGNLVVVPGEWVALKLLRIPDGPYMLLYWAVVQIFASIGMYFIRCSYVYLANGTDSEMTGIADSAAGCPPTAILVDDRKKPTA